MSTWVQVSCRPPLFPLRHGPTSMGGERWTGWVLGLFPHEEGLPADYPEVCVICGIEYDEGTIEWYTPIDSQGGLDRCTSHGYPGPTHWAELPSLP